MGKKIRKAVGAVLMALAIAITQIPVSDVEAVDTASGSDFQMDGTTLVKYKGTSSDVSIGDSVKYIEAEAFADNDNIKRISFGKELIGIGEGAFKGCNNLTTVSMPDSVEYIDNAAFADCPSLTDVRIGTGLESLGNGVFAGDINLQTVKISSGNPELTCIDGAIYSKEDNDVLYAVLSGRNSTVYDMPMSVKEIRPYAFWGDRLLKEVNISGNAGEISAYAFSNCRSLRYVNIPYSVTKINLKAFENCVSLRKITIPISVSSIHSTAFDGCTRLTIDAVDGSTAKEFADSLVLEDINVSEYEDTSIDTITDVIEEVNDAKNEDTVDGIDNYYNEVTHMSPLEDDDDETVKGRSKIIGSQAFVFVDNASATVNSGADTPNVIDGVTYGETGETIASISGNNDVKGGSFPKYTIVDDKIIAQQAYYNDERTDIEIPGTITEISDFAFARSAVESAILPEGLEEIGYAAFYHCNSLTNVVIPASVKEIGPYAFDKTPWLSDWKQSGTEDFLIVGDGILLAYRGAGGGSGADDGVTGMGGTVAIPDGVRSIGAGAFSGHGDIVKVVIPASVEIIGEGAFEDCSSLAEIEGGDGIKEIRDRAFAGCALSDIKIPASVEKIGLRAFDESDSVKNSLTGKVVFEGSSLPEISYCASSGKLYNDGYRGLVFNGVSTAVVPKNTGSMDGTVLDDKLYGFRGNVESADGSHIATVSDTDDSGNISGVAVNISSDSISDGAAYANIDGAEKGYMLNIADSDEAGSLILNAYRKLYGNNTPANIKAYDITLYEADTMIPITSLGKQSMEISIPIPDGITQDDLHVVCLDKDGQLEEVDARIATVDGFDCLTFKASHFSPYGVYNYGSGAAGGNSVTVSNGKAVFTSLSSDKDDSPDTGDNSIHPKWFLGAGLLFTGLALFFYRGRRRIKL